MLHFVYETNHSRNQHLENRGKRTIIACKKNIYKINMYQSGIRTFVEDYKLQNFLYFLEIIIPSLKTIEFF